MATKKSPTTIELDEIEQDVKKLDKKPKRKATVPKGSRMVPRSTMENGLTPQQEAYCRARALGMSKSESINMIGMSDQSDTATKWEKIHGVQKRIQELAEMITENSILKNGLDRGWIISRLMSVANRCMQAEPCKDKDGKPTGEFRFDSAGANRSLELLGKTLRMFEGKEKETTNEYSNLSDDEIARIATELAAATGLTEYIARTKEAAGSQQVIEVQAVPKAD